MRLLLDRAERRNALDRALVEALLEAFREPSEPVVVLGSTSPAAFCAGADVTLADAERADVSDRLYELYARMLDRRRRDLRARGRRRRRGGTARGRRRPAAGGPGTTIRLVGPGHGLAVGAWGLPSLVGRGRALDSACDAAGRRGRGVDDRLVDRVADAVEAGSLELAAGLAALDPAAAARVKRIAWTAAGGLEALELERDGNVGAWAGSMPREGAASG